MEFFNQNPEIAGILVIGLLALYIAIVIAILQIPKIVKNTRATMKLTALIAKEKGISRESITKVLLEADKNIFILDKELENQLG